MEGEYSHIQFTVPSKLLQGAEKQSLIAFFSQVLDWNVVFNTSDTLGFRGFRPGQYIVLKGGEPTSFQSDDHFGIATSTRDDFDELFRRAKEFQRDHGGIEVTDRDSMTNDYGAMDWFFLNSALPVTIEIRYHKPGEEFPTRPG